MAGALRIADHIYLLSKGKLDASGTPAELVATSTGLAAEFFESSGIDAKKLLREA
jgi:ABC-type transporter Mla maintaining outer membrane lipid asymmetry ATPase subunit MlaF